MDTTIKEQRGRINKSIISILLFILMTFFMTVVAYADCCNPDCDGLSIEETYCYGCLYTNWDDELKEYTKELCKDNDLEYNRVLAIIWNESRFQSDATGYNTNGTKDYGLMQLNDITFDFLSERIGIESMEDLYDAKTNILAGITILKYHKDYTGDEDAALLRYQVGEGTYANMVRSGKEPNQTFYNVIQKSEEFAEIVKDDDIEKIKSIMQKINEKVSNVKSTL